MLPALKEAVRRAVLVMQAMSDPDARFRVQFASMLLITAGDPNTGYGYNEIVIRYVPSPEDVSRAEIVERWLVWLRSVQGPVAVRRILDWARGVGIWRIAQREKCSDRTIINRIDRSMVLILRRFLDIDARVETVEGPTDKSPPYFRNGVSGQHTKAGTRSNLGKVWIDGVGYMKDGRRLRDGTHKADRGKLYRDRPK